MKILNLLAPLPPKLIFKKLLSLPYLQCFLHPDNYLKLLHFYLHAEVPIQVVRLLERLRFF